MTHTVEALDVHDVLFYAQFQLVMEVTCSAPFAGTRSERHPNRYGARMLHWIRQLLVVGEPSRKQNQQR